MSKSAKEIGWKSELTQTGFQYGNMIISRYCDNDGTDKRAKWAAIGIETPAGVWDIQSDAQGNLIIAKRPGREGGRP